MAAVYGNELGVEEVVVPNSASTNSALGLATSDILHTHSLYDFFSMPVDPDQLNKNFESLEKMINEELASDGVKEEDRVINYFLDMKYGLQVHVVTLPLERKSYATEDIEELGGAFDRLYESLYGKGAG